MQAHFPHELIAGRFELDHLLGAGGMGEVWRGTHVVTRKPVALKFLKPEAAQREAIVRRFVREARAASAVRHPNVVQVHDFLELDDGPVIVMDYLEGESLATHLERKGALALAETANILAPVISAIGHAHVQGIIHRDLKPANIFLERDLGDEMVPKVLDFGIAKLRGARSESLAAGGLTKTGELLGTPQYMAPEQAFGHSDVDHRVDVWSLGVILYQCLAGQMPIEAANVGQLYYALVVGAVVPIRSVVRDLPDDVADLVGKMLAKERADRVGDLREVLDVVSAYTQARALPFDAPRRSYVPIEPSGGAAESPPASERVSGTVDVSQHGEDSTGVEAGLVPHTTTAPATLSKAVAVRAQQDDTQRLESRQRARLLSAVVVIGGALLGLGVVGVLRAVGPATAPLPSASSVALGGVESAWQSVLVDAEAATTPVADAAANASAIASVAQVPARPGRPKGGKGPGDRSRPEAKAEASASPAASGPPRLPGGVVKSLPF